MAGPDIQLIATDPRQQAELARLHRNLGKVYATIPAYELAEITHVQPDGLGRPAWALTDKGYKVDLSLGTPIREGEQWMLRGEGGPAGRRWMAIFRMNTHGDLLGPMPGRYIPPPIIPASSYGGWETNEEGSAVTDLSGASSANAILYPRTIAISGNYDVYEMHLPAIHWRMREHNADEWNKVNSEWLHPQGRCFLTLKFDVSSAALSWAVTPDVDSLGDIPQGKLLFWYVDGEVVVGSLTGTSGAYTLAIILRGAEGTTPALHKAGARILLASGRLAISGLRQAVHYDVQLAFGGAFNEVGMWSDTVDFVSFENVAPPATVQVPPGVRVDLNHDEYQIRWTPPVDASVKQFHLLRYNGSVPTAVGTPAYFIGAPGITDLGLVAGTSAIIPANGLNTGSGSVFGVASHNNAGKESTVIWSSDDWIPIGPNPATIRIDPIAGGLRFTIGDTSAMNRSAFRRYQLWQANDIAGTGAVPIYGFPDRTQQGDFSIQKYGVVKLYQITALTWGGKESPIVNDAAHWLYAPSLLPSESYPHNGNFQVPTANGKKPLYWNMFCYRQAPDGKITIGHPAQTLTYVPVDGVSGNYCVKCASGGGWVGGFMVWRIDSQIRVPFNMRKTLFTSLYFRYNMPSPGMWDTMVLQIIPYVRLFAEPEGFNQQVGIQSGDPTFSRSTVPLRPTNVPPQPLNLWQSTGVLELINFSPSDQTAYAEFGVQVIASDNGGGLAQPFSVWLDDIVAVPDLPTRGGLIETPATISINPPH